MDVFIEKIVPRRKTLKDNLMAIGIIIVGIVLTLVVLNIPVLSSFAPVLVIAIIYFGYLFTKSINLEYEYAVTNGDIDVDKIIAQRKRKRLFSASTSDIEIVAKVRSDKYSGEYKNIRKRIEAVSSSF